MAASKTIADDVLAILSSAEIEGNLLKLTSGQLDRKMYVAVNKVLELMGGKWNRKQGGHIFPEDPTDLLDTVIVTKMVTDKKKEFQAFNTPIEIAEQLVELADIQGGQTVLEPSAGTGNLLVMIPGPVDFCEIQPELVSELLDRYGELFCDHVGDDFLAYQPGPVYDRVVANPPFTKQQDVAHVSHMIDCCKPGGRVVSVMSPGFTFRQDKKSVAFRDKLAGCRAHEVTMVDAGAFKESGTMVNTVIICIDV